MNRYPERIDINLSPGVQTVSEVVDDTVPVVNDGIKDYDIIFMIDKLFLVDNCQTLVEPNATNTAVTIKIKKTEVERFLSMLDSTKLSSQNAVSQIKQLILGRKDIALEKEWVSFQRKDVAALAILRGQLEKILINININAVTSRMLFLPIAGPEFVSKGDAVYFQSVVDLLNNDGTREGTKLIKDTIKYTPGEIGCNTLGTLVKSADISLESKAVLRQLMQNQSKDLINDRAINSVDAFCAPELVLLPLNNNQYLLKLTEIRYKQEKMTTFSTDVKTLDFDRSYAEQNWYLSNNPPAPPNPPKPETQTLYLSKTGELVQQDVESQANTPLRNILNTIWYTNIDLALGGQAAGTYLVELGYRRVKHHLHKIFPPVLLQDGKTKVDFLSNLPNLIKRGPYDLIETWTSDQIQNQPMGSLSKLFGLFLKALFLNFLPNLIRLGKYEMTKENMATETLRTLLGIYSQEYMDHVQSLILKQNVAASVVLHSRESNRG